jgi:hypothetical protein
MYNICFLSEGTEHLKNFFICPSPRANLPWTLRDEYIHPGKNTSILMALSFSGHCKHWCPQFLSVSKTFCSRTTGRHPREHEGWTPKSQPPLVVPRTLGEAVDCSGPWSCQQPVVTWRPSWRTYQEFFLTLQENLAVCLWVGDMSLLPSLLSTC